MKAQELTELSVKQVADLVRRKEVSPVELTRACLLRIEERNPEINAFITVTSDLAMEQARAAEQEIGGGHYRGPLHGIPMALKDLIDTAGVRTTAGSKVFADRVPAEDAEVVKRLYAAGVVVVGKTNLHEFAYGGSGVISAFGAVRNPRNPEYITGGSSSGSAAAVADHMCFAALGTDTAGSIRLPAACCGIVGFKPTYGLVSTAGVIPLSWSYDHVGPMTRTVDDAAIVLDALTSGNYASRLSGETRKIRVGVAREFFWYDAESEVVEQVESAIRVLTGLVASVRDILIPVDESRAVQMAEAYSFHTQQVCAKKELYDPATWLRIESGAKIGSEDYLAKRKTLDRTRAGAAAIFNDVDVIVTPTSPISPASFAELRTHPDQLRPKEVLMLRNTRALSVLGVPAISVPCGRTSAGLPIGLQIAAAPHADLTVLNVAKAYEAATEN